MYTREFVVDTTQVLKMMVQPITANHFIHGLLSNARDSDTDSRRILEEIKHKFTETGFFEGRYNRLIVRIATALHQESQGIYILWLFTDYHNLVPYIKFQINQTDEGGTHCTIDVLEVSGQIIPEFINDFLDALVQVLTSK